MKAREKLLEELMREPTYEELANHMNVSVKKIHEIETTSPNHVDVEAVNVTDEQKPDVPMHFRRLFKCISACIESDLEGHEGFVWIERKMYGRPVPEIGEKIRIETDDVRKIIRRAHNRLKRCFKNKGWQDKDLPDILKQE